MTEFHVKYRPRAYKQVIGQDAAVKQLLQLQEKGYPHALLFTGPSGCGKTTLARIVQKKLDCSDNDFAELNTADLRGIDTIRDIRSRMKLHPRGGTTRVWLIDECHQLTKDAQEALLKMLEEPPSWVYFMLATTHPNKLLDTIHTRATEIKVNLLADKAMEQLVKTVCEKEKTQLDDDVLEKLVECAGGSARKAMVILNQIIGLDSSDQLKVISKADAKEQAILIARTLINPRAKWSDITKVLESVDEDPESLRYMVLGYAAKVMTSNPKMAARAYLIITAFRDNFYDSKRAGLVAACYEVLSQ